MNTAKFHYYYYYYYYYIIIIIVIILYCNVEKLSCIDRSADSQLYTTLRERCMIVK